MAQTPGRRSKTKKKNFRLRQSVVEKGLLGPLFLGGMALILFSMYVSGRLILFSTPTLGELVEYLYGWGGLGVLLAVVVTFYCIYLYKFHRSIVANSKRWRRAVLLMVLYILSARLILEMGVSLFVIPTSLFALLLSLLYGRRFSLASLSMMTVLCSFIPGMNRVVLLVLVLGGVVVIFGTRPVASRWKLMGTGVMMVMIQGFILSGMWLAGWEEIDINTYKEGLIWGSGAGFIYVGILANACLPIIEYLFQVITHMTLLEISSQNHPLLRKLVLEAPGTYHHSLLVGNLAEAAAEATGCDWLLARVGAYYHDIGKLEKPLYFTENTTNMPNRHENLSPAMSSLIITAHTKNGVQIGRDYALPPDIIDFVEQHHGDSVVEYFYQEALARAGEGEKPSPETFRYPGPKPRTKEISIVLLADSVEAASRNLSEPTPSRIEGLVRDVVSKRLVDGQLDMCPLTLGDLKVVRENFVRVLTGMYHSRVRYPETEKNGNGN